MLPTSTTATPTLIHAFPLIYPRIPSAVGIGCFPRSGGCRPLRVPFQGMRHRATIGATAFPRLYPLTFPRICADAPLPSPTHPIAVCWRSAQEETRSIGFDRSPWSFLLPFADRCRREPAFGRRRYEYPPSYRRGFCPAGIAILIRYRDPCR